ncbi:MAG TPA: hypothetical protein PLJ38_05375, partial [bacterium]|nr:hypothetical protein [bacterium]
MQNKIVKIFNYLESDNYSVIYSALVFCVAIAFRNIIEIFAVFLYVKNNQFTYYRGNPKTLDYEVILHYFISYIAMALIMTIILRILTNENTVKILKIVCPFFFMLTVAQIFDIIICGGSNLAYFTPGYHTDLLKRFLTFYGDWRGAGGVTPGIKIEIIIAMLLAFIYVHYKTNKIYKSLLAVAAIYLLIFFYAMTPFILKFINEILGISILAPSSNSAYLYYFSILAFTTSAIILLIDFKKINFNIKFLGILAL